MGPNSTQNLAQSRIQVSSMEGPRPFLSGINSKIVKIQIKYWFLMFDSCSCILIIAIDCCSYEYCGPWASYLEIKHLLGSHPTVIWQFHVFKLNMLSLFKTIWYCVLIHFIHIKMDTYNGEKKTFAIHFKHIWLVIA